MLVQAINTGRVVVNVKLLNEAWQGVTRRVPRECATDCEGEPNVKAIPADLHHSTELH